MRGRVLWFDSSKGYGFLKGEDGAERYFHYTYLLMEGYRFIYSGTPVEFEIKDNNDGEEVVFNIKQLNRISPDGKILIVVAYMEMNDSSELMHFNFDIARKAESGIRFIKVWDQYIICTDKPIDNEQLCLIVRIINDGVKINCPVLTDTERDYIFI